MEKLNIIDNVYMPHPERQGEDVIGIGETFVCILDGATGLGGSILGLEISDAAWFVQKLSSYVFTYVNRVSGLDYAVEVAIAEIEKEFWEIATESHIEEYELPSASGVFVHLDGANINVRQYGDTELHCLHKSGNVTSMDKSPLKKLDQKAINIFRKEIYRGASVKQARENITPLLRDHRSLMNHPDGYLALSFSYKSSDSHSKACFKAQDIESILICSDGFSPVYKEYDICRISDIISGKAGSLKAITEKLRCIEERDESMRAYPRLKQFDDVSALILTTGRKTDDLRTENFIVVSDPANLPQ